MSKRFVVSWRDRASTEMSDHLFGPFTSEEGARHFAEELLTREGWYRAKAEYRVVELFPALVFGLADV